ncbi:unnamed protein product [Rotaria sordida]|uniref:SHSP domain-containing protein n=1 Tax=Rotaria sordida TaxID=392033 RepID=A0A814AS20_9BILA|nr:unnamed protein product [Rotaria sordida]CAF3980304.1 unnamed protein product [Rotaria sordida]
MASSRVVSRLLAPTTLSRLSTIGSKSGPVRYFWHHHHHRKNLAETYFGSASNVFQRWEKEFDRIQEQFNHFFQDLKNNRSLTNGNGNDFITTEYDGSKKFHLSLNVNGFQPEEIKIKTQHRTLTISAKKETKTNNNYSLQEFSQTYALPEELKIDDLKSIYTENGVLSIEAPISKEQSEDRQIKIERH